MDKREEEIAEMVKIAETDTQELVDAIFSAIERLSAKEPFTESDREVFSNFFHVVMSQLAISLKMIQYFNEIRLASKREQAANDQIVRLRKENDVLIGKILRVIQHHLTHEQSEEALELVTKLMKKYKD